MDVLWELEGLMLDYLEQLEDVGGVEGDAPEDKRVQAGAQGVDVCRPAPASTKDQAMCIISEARVWNAQIYNVVNILLSFTWTVCMSLKKSFSPERQGRFVNSLCQD